jgi:anti-sigma factor RsiW
VNLPPQEKPLRELENAQRRLSRRDRVKALLPVPKVVLPAIAGVGAVIATWIATGEFNRLELAQLFLTAWYSLIGWATPER